MQIRKWTRPIGAWALIAALSFTMVPPAALAVDDTVSTTADTMVASPADDALVLKPDTIAKVLAEYASDLAWDADTNTITVLKDCEIDKQLVFSDFPEDKPVTLELNGCTMRISVNVNYGMLMDIII